jgi:hypothetical protein
MKVSFDIKILSSFLLFIDHELQSKAEAFFNNSGRLYPVSTNVNGFTAYATPYRQLCNDTSISGANIMSGVYVNGNFVGIGQSGLRMINHDLGTAYFSGTLPANAVVSGRYAIKDFSIQYTDQIEYKLLFETKYVTNSKFNQTLSGLASDVKTSPAIFLRAKVTENLPFSFGGLDDNSFKIRAILIADNEFQRIAACNVFKNMNLRTFNVVDSTPFDYLGNYTGLNYNYNNLSFVSGYESLISEVKVIDVPLKGEFENVPRSIAMVDFTVSTIMRH